MSDELKSKQKDFEYDVQKLCSLIAQEQKAEMAMKIMEFIPQEPRRSAQVLKQCFNGVNWSHKMKNEFLSRFMEKWRPKD